MATQEMVLDSPTEALVIPPPKDALALGRAPDLVLGEAKRAAEALTQVIEGKPKKVVLNGKTYLQFEDWQTLGRFYGVTPAVLDSKYVEFGEGDDKVRGFEARAQALLVSTNQVISAAEAMCLDDEENWGYRNSKNGRVRVPLFQLKSMAQTRAMAKAMRNVLSWVVVLAGYAPTPAEEMTGDEGGQPIFQPPQRKSQAVEAKVIEAPKVTPETASPFEKDTQRKTCSHDHIIPAGVSKKTGKPYGAFCKDCGAHV